jgi:hypothetical protein
MLILIGEILIDLVFVASVVVVVSCLAYLLSLTAREHRELNAVPRENAPARGRTIADWLLVPSLRLGIARRHTTSSG